MSSPEPVPDNRIPEHAYRLAAGPVTRGDLALAFSRSYASSVDVHVEGRNFYPPMLEDIASASSSAGVRILEYPTMLHAKAFVRDGEELLAGTCNLEAWSLKRFFEIDLQVWSKAVASQFEQRFSAEAETVSSPGRPLGGAKERARATVFAALSPLL